MDCSPRTAFPNAFVSFLCEAYEEILFTLHLSLGIPCVYRHSRRWRVFGHSSPTLHHSSPLCFDGFAYLLTPRCLVPWWRVVKSGWRVADNSSPLETPCLSAFLGIRWRVKSFWRNRSKPRLPLCSRGFSYHYVSRIWLLLLFFCTILLNCMFLFGSYNILL